MNNRASFNRLKLHETHCLSFIEKSYILVGRINKIINK
jgi:hypothetical protein